MLITENPSEACLIIKRKYPTTPERLFEAWTTPEQIKKWFTPSCGYRTSKVEVDARVGGSYRIEIIDEREGQELYTNITTGTYTTFEKPTKLAFSWQWISKKNPEQTHVTLEFNACGDETELILTHDKHSSVEIRDEHIHGWSGCLDGLFKLVDA